LFTAVLVLIVLILLNAFFAASEIALISLNDNKVKAMAEEGDKKAKLLHNLLSEPSRFLATIQIGITLAGFLASAFAADSFAGNLADALYALGVPLSREFLESTSIILITIVLSYFTLVLGELVPKRIAMNKPEAISNIAVTPLTILSKVTAPFVKFLTLSTNMMVRMFGVDPNEQKERVTEEEILMMIDVGKENGTIQETEKIMISNIFDFDNKSVSEIMTHRRNVVGIPVEYNLRETAKVINDEKFTRFPVYEDNIDNIIGILHVKDLFAFIQNGQEETFDLRKITRKPYFIPEAKKIDELLQELQGNKLQMAVAVDEYGGTAGIVTIEDMLEEIVGNIYDEYDEEEEKEFEKIDEDTYLINGSFSLRSVNTLLDLELPTEEYDTLGGFMIGFLGRIPESHEKPKMEYGGYVFSVEELDDMRIQKVKIHRMEATTENKEVS